MGHRDPQTTLQTHHAGEALLEGDGIGLGVYVLLVHQSEPFDPVVFGTSWIATGEPGKTGALLGGGRTGAADPDGCIRLLTASLCTAGYQSARVRRPNLQVVHHVLQRQDDVCIRIFRDPEGRVGHFSFTGRKAHEQG